MKVFGKRIKIHTSFKDFIIAPAYEAKHRIYSDGIEIDERDTTEPRVYLIKLKKGTMSEFLAMLEAYQEIILYCPRYQIAKKFYERNYDIVVDSDGFVKKVKRADGHTKVAYDKIVFYGCIPISKRG
jgi:hypothetical protein